MTSAVLAGRPVLLLNASYEELGRLSVQKAIRLLALGKAVVHEADESRERLRLWAYPKVIKLVYYVKVAYDKIYGAPAFSRRGVLIRDGYECAYCGGRASTIDHIMPRSRGGANDWSNTIASCFSCNNKKDNKTPKEAGMKLRFEPRIPKRIDLMAK